MDMTKKEFIEIVTAYNWTTKYHVGYRFYPDDNLNSLGFHNVIRIAHDGHEEIFTYSLLEHGGKLYAVQSTWDPSGIEVQIEASNDKKTLKFHAKEPFELIAHEKVQNPKKFKS